MNGAKTEMEKIKKNVETWKRMLVHTAAVFGKDEEFMTELVDDVIKKVVQACREAYTKYGAEFADEPEFLQKAPKNVRKR